MRNSWPFGQESGPFKKDGHQEKGEGKLALLKPALLIGRLAELNPAYWYEKGIRAILIDLDNTISPWRQNRVTRDARDFFDRAREAGIKVVLFTNAKEPRARKAAGGLGLEAVSYTHLDVYKRQPMRRIPKAGGSRSAGPGKLPGSATGNTPRAFS